MDIAIGIVSPGVFVIPWIAGLEWVFSTFLSAFAVLLLVVLLLKVIPVL